jgi:D-aspartate ligase
MSKVDTSVRPGAIVLGGNFVGLGVVRSLGSRGVPVWVFDTNRSQSIAQFSRFTRRFVASTRDIHELLLEEGRRHNLHGWVVYPVRDEYVEALAEHHESLSTIYRLATAPMSVTRFALDKRLTYQKARELNIAAPWTVTGDAIAGDAAVASAAKLPYPVILKPAVNHHFFPHTNVKALSADTPEELEHAFARMRVHIPAEEILVQERIPGDGEQQYSFCAACKNGQVYASLVARRRRQYPIEFGNASSFVETVEEPAVEAQGRRFLEGIDFDGIVEIEFKRDTRDGTFKILDVNTRPWGWHTLGKAAGVDFVSLLWEEKTTGRVPVVGKRRNAKWLREITDPLAILKARRPVVEALRTIAAFAKGQVTLAAFSIRDPLPFFAEYVLWVWQGASRQRKARAAARQVAPDTN